MDELIPILSIFFVIGVPVMSIAGHFVLRPLVRDIIQAISGRSLQEKSDTDERLAIDKFLPIFHRQILSRAAKSDRPATG